MRRFTLSDFALARPVTVGMLLIAVLVLGVIGATQMPLAFLPRRVSANAWLRVQIARTSPARSRSGWRRAPNGERPAYWAPVARS